MTRRAGKRRNRGIMAALLAALLIAGGLAVAAWLSTGSYWVGGGSVWQFDYRLSRLIVRGINPDTGAAVEKEYTDPPSPYEWTVNIDGDLDPNTGAGRIPGLEVTVGIVGRCDKEGNLLGWKQQDPNQESYTADGKTYYLYYYLFDVKVATAEQQATNMWGVPACEYGEVESWVTITILLDKSIFESEVDAYYADARIHDLDFTDPLYNPQYSYWLPPAIDVVQDIGDGVAFSPPREQPGHKEADLTFHQVLTGGAVRVGFLGTGSAKYDVYLVKRVKVALLLAEPLSVGEYTSVEPFDPPPLGAPWWLFWVLLAVGVAVFLAALLIIGWAWSRRPKTVRRVA